MIATDQIEGDPSTDTGYIGRIPVRNVWLLLLYASELFRQIQRAKRNAIEDNPDDIPDLVAEILARAVERRLQRNLSFGYRWREAEMSRVRGRIQLLRTERRQLLQRGRVACRFEELTVDTPQNRLVLAALKKIAKVARRDDLRLRCRSLVATLDRLGVSRAFVLRSDIGAALFGRLDAADRLMVSAARLAFELALPTESAGQQYVSPLDLEKMSFGTLFERAVGGFYDVALNELDWRVHRGKTLKWPTMPKGADMDGILPIMITDIIVDNRSAGIRTVIDTKFTDILTKGQFGKHVLKSAHIYQIYAYLRSQEESGVELDAYASGLLLHPAIGKNVDESVVIQGHRIRFATVNLAAEAGEIRRQLLDAVGEDAALAG